jgi:hypothetical protein
MVTDGTASVSQVDHIASFCHERDKKPNLATPRLHVQLNGHAKERQESSSVDSFRRIFFVFEGI